MVKKPLNSRQASCRDPMRQWGAQHPGRLCGYCSWEGKAAFFSGGGRVVGDRGVVPAVCSDETCSDETRMGLGGNRCTAVCSVVFKQLCTFILRGTG